MYIYEVHKGTTWPSPNTLDTQNEELPLWKNIN